VTATEGLAETRLRPGDRAPDVVGLRREKVGFPLRLFDVLRGTVHVLLIRPTEPMYTFWHYMRNRWERNAGLRIDHVLLSPAAADRLQAAEKAVRPRRRGIHGQNHDASPRAAEIDPEFVDHAGVELRRSGKGRNEGAVKCLLRADDEADAA
jgi:hypothetical protein